MNETARRVVGQLHVRAITLIVVLLLALSLGVGAVPTATPVPSVTATPPRLTTDAVLRLSARAAERHGYKLQEFEEPRAPKFEPKDQTWAVFYQGKLRKPGNHFLVIVHDYKQTTEVIEGE